jgi:dinuclear metal center YbgI/SA1388 family protein
MLLADIIARLDEILESEAFIDYGPNGLQVPNSTEIRTVATGVSASEGLFLKAAEAGAQLVLVHHGLFWKGMPQHVDAALYKRLKPLFDHDMALAAYHLPLDGHPAHGNNALLADRLGCETRTPCFAHEGRTIGIAGRFGGDGLTPSELHARVREATGREPLLLDSGPERIRTIGIVSGAGASYLGEAIARGHDAFLTGEPAERVMTQAREAGIHFVAAGHYATETFGVQRLGDLLSQHFGVKHVFIDDPNPI